MEDDGPFPPGSVEDVLARADRIIEEYQKKVKWVKLRESDELTGWRKVFSRHYILPNGKEKGFDISHHHDSTAVLAITEDEHVVLVKQFRPGPERWLLELPGGLIDEGEDAKTGAARELLEETGFSGELQDTGVFWTSAYSTSRKHTYLATGCVLTQAQDTDDDEFIEVIEMPLDAFREWLDHTEMVDASAAYRALKVYDGQRLESP